ncbi:MAG TPA: hypothetical protein VFS56_06350 [Gemmatimonadaceae bacterium]|nr:hypothetical protein [Gemmatimonadaceae bacterium]
MARAYTVGTIALTLGVPTRWVDNILSHHRVSGVVQKRQGVARKVAFEGLLQLSLSLSLIDELEIPAASALRVASSMLATGGRYDTPTGISISIDLDQVRTDLEGWLAQAVEIAPVPRRGRPPRTAKRHPSKTGRLE